jgi:malonyl-CoA/methylmalonyl-CoA synthetase
MNVSFFQLILDSFAHHPLRPAVIHDGRDFTYADLLARAREGAGWLQSLGVNAGDRVVICTAHKRAFLFAHLAALFAGAVTVPLNPRFTREELRFFLSDSGAHTAIAGDDAFANIESLRPELPLRNLVRDLTIHDSPKSTYRAPNITADMPCMIIYSSGTTGWPKGVVHTHANVGSALSALAACWSFTPQDVVLNVLPLYHVHGLSFATQLTLMTGACVMLEDFEPQRVIMRMNECSVFMSVPTIYYRLLEQVNFKSAAKTWTRPRLFTCGSAPIRAEMLPELEAILGKPIINRYGMTEAFVITSLPLQGPWPHGSVGRPLAGVELRVVSESGASTTEVGAVQIRGPNLFRGYWNKSSAGPPSPPAPLPGGEGSRSSSDRPHSPPGPLAKEEWKEEWFDTGDLGSLDAKGFLTLVGRKNDLIITSGFNVYPQVVERVINECPGVRESAVIGVPDEHKGERVVAVVVRDDTSLDEARLRAFVSERLVDYQRPRAIVFVEALPRNTMGKVLRRELRERVAGDQP